MNLPLLTSRSRIMLFAPHPDDESLATGVFLQRAICAGASVRVVYATDGERNCWPQRVLERKVRLRESDRRRWGARRRNEALEALRVLGIERSDVRFLSLPDQGVTDLLLSGCGKTLRRLAQAIADWRPTHLLIPSEHDTHPDHSGLAILLRLALQDHCATSSRLISLFYLVHGASESFALRSRVVAPKPREESAKRRAILCHATQVALSRRRFLAYAQRPERFVVGDRESTIPVFNGPIRSLVRSRGQLRLEVSFPLKPLRAETATLYLVGRDLFGTVRRFRAALPGRTDRISLLDCASEEVAAIGSYRGDAFRAEILLPLNGLATSQPVYLKLDRRVWFFDEAGWLEVPAIAVPMETSLAALAVA
jgi:LmbE family N-acetylglucosaminyl deacetylase